MWTCVRKHRACFAVPLCRYLRLFFEFAMNGTEKKTIQVSNNHSRLAPFHFSCTNKNRIKIIAKSNLMLLAIETSLEDRPWRIRICSAIVIRISANIRAARHRMWPKGVIGNPGTRNQDNTE